jgi:prevent-host-death family protein
MKQVPASRFKEQCLSILDRVDDEGIVITKRGKPVAKLIPIRASSAELIGSLKGKLKIKGDILSASTGAEPVTCRSWRPGRRLRPARTARAPAR